MADSTQASITIAAAAGSVLDVIADLEVYPEWAGEITHVVVLTEEGDGWPDRARLTMDAGIIKDTYTLDYDWNVTDDGTGSVSWRLVEASVLKVMDGTYTLRAIDDGGTEVTYELTVDLKIPVLGMLKRKAERVIIDTALTGLKKRVESL
ncbi:MAG: SRPBCC family protein [Tetrasphaera sp.]